MLVSEKGGEAQTLRFDKSEVTIGRIQGNDVVLPKSNISKKHARIVQNDGGFVVIDSKSTNGTYVNGKRIEAPHDLKQGDRVYVGDFTIEVTSGEASAAKPRRDADDAFTDDGWDDKAPAPPLADDWAKDDAGLDIGASPAGAAAGAVLDAGKGPEPERRPELMKSTRRMMAPSELAGRAGSVKAVHERLLATLDLRRLAIERMDDAELRARTRKAVDEIIGAMLADKELPPETDRQTLAKDVLDEALGLGPLEELLDDDGVTEIIVNGADSVYVERDGRLERSERTFSSDRAVLGVIERIVAPIGRRIDESSPMVDARLKDGSRVNAIIPPLAIKGPCLTIRKFTREPLQIDDLVTSSTLTPEVATFLETCVLARKNIVISGGTGSGKTTTLNVLSGFIPESERIITIEDAAELKLEQEHVVALESRPPNIEGKGAVTIRDLVRNALRMRPDRVVVGECRGGEALDMLQAMNTGHEGSLTTVHANGPRDALSRLETMVLMSGMELPLRAIRDQIASAVDIVVQQTRFPDGSRRVTHVSEVTGMEGDVVSMQDLFVFTQRGFDRSGKVQGTLAPTGAMPRFYEDLEAQGLEADRSIFQPR
jgi:pilus assembly protein CpaF